MYAGIISEPNSIISSMHLGEIGIDQVTIKTIKISLNKKKISKG